MWLQDLFFLLVLALLLAGLFMSGRLIRNGRWEALGLMVGAFYFVFFPLIVSRELIVLEVNIPSFPSTTFPLVVLSIYTVETLLIFAFLSQKKIGTKPVNPKREMFVYWVAIVVYFIIQLYVLFGSGLLQGGHWYFTRHEFIMESGTLIIFMMYLLWASRLIIVSFTFEFLHLKRLTLFEAGFIVMLIGGYEFLFVGNRIVILMFGIAGFLYIAKRFGVRVLLLVISSLLPVMISLGVYQDVRRLLYQLTPVEFFQTLVQAVTNQNILLGLAKVFESWDLLIMLDLFTKTGDTFVPIYGSSFLRVFAWVIPRSIWTSKPLTVTVQVGELYVPGRGVSFAPLFWGEVHYNFGVLGLLLYPLILWLVLKAIEALCEKVKLNNYLKFLLGFLIFRLPIADMIINAFILSLIYISAALVWQILPKKKPLAKRISGAE